MVQDAMVQDAMVQDVTVQGTTFQHMTGKKEGRTNGAGRAGRAGFARTGAINEQ